MVKTLDWGSGEFCPVHSSAAESLCDFWQVIYFGHASVARLFLLPCSLSSVYTGAALHCVQQTA